MRLKNTITQNCNKRIRNQEKGEVKGGDGGLQGKGEVGKEGAREEGWYCWLAG